MKRLAIALATLSLCAACGDDAKQNATENSAQIATDPYPAASAQQEGIETPAETRRDVVAAAQDARETEVQTDAASVVAEADSKRQIDIERCDALTGASRESCIAKANAEFERVKERVKKELDEDLKR